MSSKPPPGPYQYIGLGLTIAACLVAGMGGGYLLGERVGVTVLLTFVGLMVGVAAAVWTTRSEIKRYM